MPDDADLLERFRQRDRLALSRLLSLAARGFAGRTLDQLEKPAHPARVLALTGAGGVGKSTLVGKLIEHFRKSGQTVAVLACDPQSPLSGGALLGDRFRMPSQPDDGVFIRSLVASAGSGPLAEHLEPMIRLLEAFGFDLVVIETAGAGQGDTAVHALADGLVLLLQPEAGDDLQWEKAGLMEVADIIVVNKGDLPRADEAVAQVRSALDLVSGGRAIPVLKVSAKTGAGLEELGKAIADLPLRRGAAAPGSLLKLVQEKVAERLARETQLQELAGRWQKQEVTRDDALREAFRLLAAKS